LRHPNTKILKPIYSSS